MNKLFAKVGIRHLFRESPKVSHQQVSLAWRYASRISGYGILIAIALYFLVLNEFGSGNAALWLVVVISLTLARVLLGLYYTKQVTDFNELEASFGLYLSMNIASSLAWGGALFMLDTRMPIEMIFIVSVSLGLITIVGMMVNFSVWSGAIAFIAPLTAMQIAWMLINKPPYYEWIAVLLFLFAIVLISLSYSMCKQFKKMINLIGDNVNLVRTLTATSDELSDQSNQLKLIEAYAESSDDRFQSLVQTAPDGILVTDGEGRITFVNEAGLEMFGYDESELVGKTVEYLIPYRFEQHASWRKQFVRDSKNKKMGREGEVFCLRKDGDEFSADIRLIPVFIKGQQFVYAYIRDVSKQRYVDAIIEEIREKEFAQQQLATEKDRLENYMDNVEVVLVVINEDMEIEFINRKGRELVGYTKDNPNDRQLIESMLRRNHVEDVSDFLKRIFEQKSTEDRYYYNTIVSDTGETRYYEWRLAQTRDRNAKQVILASGTDITKRKQLEELIASVAASLQMHTGANFLSSLVKSLANTLAADHVLISKLNLPERITMETLAVWHEGRIIENRCVNIKESPFETVARGQIHSVLSDLDKKYPDVEYIQNIGASAYVAVPLFNSRRAVIGELVFFYKKPLSNINLERSICNIYSVVAASEIERLEGIEDREQIEKQLQQAQKMESIGQMTGGIAHDFNNMLASILGFTELALYKVGDSDKKLKNYLTNVQDTGEQAKELVKKMLTYSRQMRGEMQSLPISPVIDEAVRMVRPMLPSSIQIHEFVEQGLPRVNMDPVQLNQTLVNLFVNARDAIGEKGSISINVSRQHHVGTHCTSCMQYIEDDMIEIAVSDTGSGIEFSDLDKIFEPFVTNKDIGKGTGMGLAMVHGIIHEHGGHIVVQTELGKGSVFKLYLPASSIQEEIDNNKGEEVNTNSINGTGKYLMIVDDETMVATLLSEVVTNYGFSADVYNNSVEAFEAYSVNPNKYDLVITDHTMPEMTGAELSEKILHENSDQAIMLCTGYSDYMNEDRAQEIGIAAYMNKPLDHGEFIRTVDMLTSIK